MEKKDYFVVQEDTDIYNVFSKQDFNDGWLEGHENEEGYHIDDFDIIEWFSTFDDAMTWIDEH